MNSWFLLPLFLTVSSFVSGQHNPSARSFVGCYALRIEGRHPFTSGDDNVLPRRFELAELGVVNNLDSTIRWDLPLSSWTVHRDGSLNIVFSTGYVGWNLRMAGSRTDLRGTGHYFTDTDLDPSDSAQVFARAVKCKKPDQHR